MKRAALALLLAMLAGCPSPGSVRVSNHLVGVRPAALASPSPSVVSTPPASDASPAPVAVAPQPSVTPTPTSSAPALFIGGGGGGGGPAPAPTATPLPATVVDVVTNTPAVFVAPAASVTVTATVRRSDGSTDSHVVWSTSDAGVATVTNAGLITGVSEGTATLTATSVADPAKSVTIPVAVSGLVLSSVMTVTPSSANRAVGSTVQLSAVAHFSDGSQSSAVDWVSSDPTVATVTPTGLVTAIALGTATISVTPTGDPSGPRADCAIAVAARQPLSVTIAPGSLTLTGQTTQALVATVSYNDNTTDNLVNWSSFTPMVAKVDGSGNVTGVQVGGTVIRAQSQADPAILKDIPVTVKAPVGNRAPTGVNATVTELNPGAFPRKVRFTSPTATDPDGDHITFYWTLLATSGTLSATTGLSTELTVAAPGNYAVELRAVDTAGLTGSTQFRVEIQ